MGDAAQVSYWDEAAATLEGARRAAWDEPPEMYNTRADECAEAVVQLLGNVPGEGRWSYVLDLGCGPGRLLHSVRRLRPWWSLMGVDSSPAMVDWARQIVEPPGSAEVGDVTALHPKWGRSFHAAWSVAVLQHLWRRQQEAVVAEVGRVLSRGGRAVLQVVEGSGSAGQLAHDTSAADLRGWAEEAGMTVVAETRGLVQPGWLWVTLAKP